MNDLVEISNHQAVTSSLTISEAFGKQHKHVLDAIESIKAENPAVTPMFLESTYQAGTGKNYKMYLMNRDGFTLLAMGFTGKEALEWKLKYIDAFNQMEHQLAIPQVNTKQLEIDDRKSKCQEAELWMRLGDRSGIPEFRQITDSYASQVLAGERIIPLPAMERKTYSATEVAERLHTTANRIGKIANANNLKTEEYGKWFYDKSRYSNKEVSAFRYYENAFPVFKRYL